jgi:prephenate dehydrogenase
MKALNDTHLCIIGTGLMGSSLALALRGKVRHLHGIDPDPSAAPYFDTFSDALHSLYNADVIVLATPIRAILELLPQVGALAAAGALITDLGSVKAPIMAAMAALPPRVQAVGGHPMCGKELSGASVADPMLYAGCTYVLCATERTSQAALSFMETLVRAIGAQPLHLAPSAHDQAVAQISHLPYLLSVALMLSAAEADDERLWQLAASGFRDTSRLASSDVTMMGDVVMGNRAALLSALTRYAEQLADLQALLAADDEAALRARLEQARRARQAWLQYKERWKA